MQREEVKSSSLESIGYDWDSHVLEIAFRHGGVYHYQPVPEQIWLSLMRATSKGRYFEKAIRDRFNCQRVE